MTLNATLPRTAKAARLVSVAEVKQLLRDAAVCKLEVFGLS